MRIITKIIFIIIIFPLLSGCIDGSKLSYSQQEQRIIKPRFIDKVAIKDNVDYSNFPGLHIKTERMDEEQFRAILHYPQTEVSSVNDEIKLYIDNVKASFLQIVNQHDKLDERTPTLHLSFKPYKVEEDVYSIVFKETMYIGTIKKEQKYKSLIFSISQETILGLNDFFHTGDDFLNFLSSYTREEINSHLDIDFGLETLAEPVINNFPQFALTSEELLLPFNKGEITPGQYDALIVSIPLVELIDFMNDRFIDLYMLEKIVAINKILPETVDNTQPNNTAADDDLSLDSMEQIMDEHSIERKKIALTFDDGPHPEYTLEILEYLKEYNATATFYMLGNRIEFYSDIVKRVYEDGHELGNHSWSHPDFTTLSDSEIKSQIVRTNEAFFQVIGEYPVTFRPPFGSINNRVISNIDQPIILWSVDTQDWRMKDSNQIMNIINKDVKPGAIILMHDIKKTTVPAVKETLEQLSAEGYEFVSVSELLDLDHSSPAANLYYSNYE